MPTCFLTDNGSVRASSTLNLRRIAAALERETGQATVPVSLLHSSRVDPAELGGHPAQLLEAALRRRLEEGETEFLVVPLFFGPSRALSSYLPRRLAGLKKTFPRARVTIAPCLIDPADGTDVRLAEILRQRVEEVLPAGEARPVVLVDHGSPVPEVTYVRNLVAGQLSVLLQGRARRLTAASMERRPGEAYRFSGPLLEEVLGWEGYNRGAVVVAMMFLSPGRHAGEGGDVARICERAESGSPNLTVTMTRLVGDHPALIAILADRMRQGLLAGGAANPF